MSKSAVIYLTEGVDKFPISTAEREEVKSKFGSPGCSFAKDKAGKFFCYTHRARSKSYDTISAIPKSKVDFIVSTG